MSKSEFPETRLSKIGKKIGWIFSPLLLISLVIFTLVIAEGLQIDFTNRSIEKKSSIEVKDIKNATVYIDSKEVGKAPNIFDTTAPNINLKVVKEGRIDWSKNVVPESGFVKTYYPVLFPKTLNFEEEKDIKTNKVYVNKYSNNFFYETIENEKVLIHKYSIKDQFFGSNVSNEVFADITNYIRLSNIASVTPTLTFAPTITPLPTPQPKEITSEFKLKEYGILPSNNGKSILLQIYGERALIVDERGNVATLSNIVPQKEDEFLWSPGDNYMVYKTGNDIYTVQLSTGRLLVIYKNQNKDETPEIQFLLETGLVYKAQNHTYTDLIQVAYEGTPSQKIELPNVNDIRKDNLVKAYDFLKKANLILIQTKENVFSYNPLTFDIKKLNRFAGENIVYTDPDKQIIVTVNTSNLNQFVYYNLDRQERKPFIVDGLEDKSMPVNVIGYNGSQNLVLSYTNKVIFMDIDGSNKIIYTDFKKPEVILATKTDNNVYIIVKDEINITEGNSNIVNNSKIMVEKFEN